MKAGRLSENIVKLSVLNQLHAKNNQVLGGAAVGTDCAFLNSSDIGAVAACTVEAEVVLKKNYVKVSGFQMTMAGLITQCVNRLAAAGAEPVSVMIAFFLPGQTENEEIRLLVTEADEACSSLGLQIGGVQCRVLEGLSSVLAVVNGYGKAYRDLCPVSKAVKPGQEIVLSKWVGLQGTAILAKYHREKLMERYPVFLAETAEKFEDFCSIVPEAKISWNFGASAMIPASEGGIFAALWEFGEKAGLGFEIDLKKIPIRQETVEVCESCGANPYELLSEGCLVMASDHGGGLVQVLTDSGIPAAVIGRMTDGKAKIIRNDEEVRYMDRPKQDEIFRTPL